jgi:hypothetical protein
MRDRFTGRTRARPNWLLLTALLALPLAGAGCKKPEVCDDTVDNDGDGQVDCADTQDCSLAPNCVVEDCGNGAIDAGEECDGANLNNQDCTDEGFGSGVLSCNDDCTLNTDQCINLDCGNGVIDAGEQCDGNNLNGQDCTDQGFDAGTLACAANCTFDTGACINNDCGNGVVDAGEECDGNDLGGEDCVSQGFVSGTLICAVNCTLDDTGCTAELCGNGIDDDNNGIIDCNEVGCAADANCDTPSANNNAVGAGFRTALALAVSNNGATAFFSAVNANGQAAIFSVATAGGNAVQLFAGAPLDKPTGLTLSPDGTTLFIADLSSGANELGGFFSLPAAGGAPTAINVNNVVRPSTIAVSNDGLTLFVGGANAANGQTGVFSVPVFGGNATLLSALNDPAALSVAGNQVLAIEAVSANGRSSVVKIPAAGGAPTVLATGFHMDYPAGVSSLVGDATVVFSAVDVNLPNFGSGLFQVGINGGAITPLDVGDTFVSAGALARARNNNNFVLVDTEAGAGVTGAIFRLQ